MKFPKQLSPSKYQNWLVVRIDSICLSVRVIPWLFPLVYMTSETIGLCNGLSPGRRQAIIWATILCTHLTHTKSGVDAAPMALSFMYCKLTIIGSDNGLSPDQRQAIIWTNAGILLIEPLGTNFSEILIGIQTFSFTKMRMKMSSAKWRPFCLGLNVLTHYFRWLNAKEANPQCTEAASLVSFALSHPFIICHQLDMPAVRYDLSGGLPTRLWLFIY